MKTKIASELMLAFILIGMVTLAFEAQRTDADPKTIVVPDDYPTIQEAVDASSVEDTVYVRAGIYYEHVVVNKSISLIEENRDTTTICGGTFCIRGCACVSRQCCHSWFHRGR